MADQNINIIVRMKAEIDAAMNKVKSALQGVEKQSTNTNKGLLKSFRDTIQPASLLLRTITRVGFIWGATFGGMGAAVISVGKEIKELDSLSFQLGISTEALSKRMHGFNMATENARIGGSQMSTIWSNVVRVWDRVKTKAAEITGAIAVVNRAQELELKATGTYTGDKKWEEMAKKQLIVEQKARDGANKETVKMEAQLVNEINKLKLSQANYSKYLLDQQVNNMRIAGVKELEIQEYVSLRLKEINEQRFGFKRWTDFIDNEFKTTIGSMKSTLSDFFQDAFTGELQSGKEYFAEFGRSILRMFSNMIAEMVARWIMFGSIMEGSSVGKWVGLAGSIFGAFAGIGSGAIQGGVGGQTVSTGTQTVAGHTFTTAWSPYHTGGIIRAHNGLKIDEVPIIAQTGERVLSRGQNRDYEDTMSGRGKDPAVVVIQAWDTQDIMRNRKSIEGIIVNALRQNSQVRGAIKSYG